MLETQSDQFLEFNYDKNITKKDVQNIEANSSEDDECKKDHDDEFENEADKLEPELTTDPSAQKKRESKS